MQSLTRNLPLRPLACLALALALAPALANPLADSIAATARQGAVAAPQDPAMVAGMQKMFDKYPDKFPEEIRRKFLARQVVVGMDPYLAHLAGGAFAFRVDADPQAWPGQADPYRVMWG